MPPAPRYDRDVRAVLLRRVADLRQTCAALAEQTRSRRERAEALAEQVRTQRRLRWQARYEHAFDRHERLLGEDDFPEEG